VVSGTLAPDKLDAAVQLWKESVAPSVQQQKGFKGVHLLVDRERGKITTMGLWETEADFNATVDWNQQQIAKFANLFSAPPTVEGYEVAAEG
jgi:heme-degrading monooxygenase HmoA